VAEVAEVAAAAVVDGGTAINLQLTVFGVQTGWTPSFSLFQVPAWERQTETGNQSTMEEHIQVEGRIFSVLAGTMFRVELDNKHQVLATISGKMRKRWVRLTVGDRVRMEMSPYDLNKARIVWRLG
jgi:translation initiation factor IF-1